MCGSHAHTCKLSLFRPRQQPQFMLNLFHTPDAQCSEQIANKNNKKIIIISLMILKKKKKKKN